MKYYLLIIMIFCGAGINKVSCGNKSDKPDLSGYVFFQEEPFYFLNPVPVKVRLLGSVDLSFFRNQIVVSQFRYRLETPGGEESAIARNLIKWSAWSNFDLTPVKIPKLDQEGVYKIIIEYKAKSGDETKKFERQFYAYQVYLTNTPIANYNVPVKTDKATATKETPTNKVSPAINTQPVTEKRAQTMPKAGSLTAEIRESSDKREDLKNFKIKVDIIPKIIPVGNLTADLTDKASVGKNLAPDYDELLAEAVEKKDTVLLRESVSNGADTALKGKYGGNIFHLLDETIGEDIISLLKNRGFSINETDNEGNSPLQFAILSGKDGYARTLIDQGADLNVKNNLELSPLHLAVLLNNAEVVKALIKKGAEINLKGNTGYTPLHIASEMNYFDIAKDLLNSGAKITIKTSQGLSPITIARIQNNTDMLKLMREKDSILINPAGTISPNYLSILNYNKNPYPEIDFTLPFDNTLAKRRQFFKVIQFISVPLFTLSAANTIIMKSKADHYYSLSKIAETEDIAKKYYDMTNQYDKNAYISGGISLVTLYGLIQSTLIEKSVSRKMRRPFI